MTTSDDRLDRIEALQLQAQQQLNATQQRIDATQRQIDANALAIAELTTNAEADRKMIWASLEQHDVVLARIDRVLDENQQILNYLFGQQRGNGHNDNPIQD